MPHSVSIDKLADFTIHALNMDPFEQQKIREQIEPFFMPLGVKCEFSSQVSELLIQLPSPRWGCLILDGRIPFYNTSELLDLIKKHDPTLPLIFLGEHKDLEVAVEVLKKGAFDFLAKPFSEQRLLDSISLALRKRQESQAEKAILEETEKYFSSLSNRENQVLHHLLEGQSNKKIGDSLSISIKTVEQHRSNIMKKMRATSLAKLVKKITHYQIKNSLFFQTR